MASATTVQESVMSKAPSMDERTIKINRLKLIAIFAVAVVPVVLATVMYFGGIAVPSSKTNKGHLIWPPVALETLQDKAMLGNKLSVNESILAAKKWTLLITGGSQCEQACEELIHTVRQVNVSMAKEMDRVNRVLASSLSATHVAALEERYPNMTAHYVDEPDVVRFEAVAAEHGGMNKAEQNSAWKVWIVDPLGNVIVQFTDQHTGYDMIHDLKKLLKLSNIG